MRAWVKPRAPAGAAAAAPPSSSASEADALSATARASASSTARSRWNRKAPVGLCCVGGDGADRAGLGWGSGTDGRTW